MLHIGVESRVDLIHTFLSIDTQNNYNLVSADSNEFCH